jgi:prepilin signal peptidase PulO-like enzyme (type II secretory pathway)
MFYFFVFIIGICWGSFANVLIDRGQKEKSILGRSRCDYCHYKLRWFDNIPILSFLILRGKCRKCKKKLSWQYPILEFLTGVLFVVVFWFLRVNNLFEISYFDSYNLVNLIYYLSIFYLLWIILVWDFKYMIISDWLILIGVALTFLYKFLETILAGDFLAFNSPLLNGLLGGFVLSGFFAILYWYSKGKWIGGGDVKLGFWLGLIAGLNMVYFLILFSYTLGSLVAIYLLLFSKKKMKSEIPFGPFLVIGTWLVIFFESEILNIWNNLI